MFIFHLLSCLHLIRQPSSLAVVMKHHGSVPCVERQQIKNAQTHAFAHTLCICAYQQLSTRTRSCIHKYMLLFKLCSASALNTYAYYVRVSTWLCSHACTQRNCVRVVSVGKIKLNRCFYPRCEWHVALRLTSHCSWGELSLTCKVGFRVWVHPLFFIHLIARTNLSRQTSACQIMQSSLPV